MRALILFIVLLILACKPSGSDIPTGDGHIPAHDLWGDMLKKHVTSDGDVDYQQWKNDSTRLSSYLNDLSKHPPSDNWSEEEKLAYWINAYNAFTVKLILDHYPVGSIKDIKQGIPLVNSVWDIKFFQIGGKDLDLNTIEHGILRKDFDEPRIHFAINCASISCPRLRKEAYKAESLDTQLTDQAMTFLEDPEKNVINREHIQISPIFKWFAGDFKREGTIIEFLIKYSDTEIDRDAKVDYMDYDWGINAVNK